MSKFVSYPVDLSSTIYPEKLRLIRNPPGIIYCRGDVDSAVLTRKTVGIVGSRKISSYAYAALDILFKDLNVTCVTTVSGFMYGVDTAAHTLSLKNNVPTIAVLPCGIDLIHPHSNYDLYHKIPQAGGLILSEYAGVTAPKRWTYPQRNRIIAALSDVLVVVQAGLRSGSLITAEFAKKFEKPVFTVPASLTHGGFEGNLQLLSKFAKAFVSGRQINNILGIVAPVETCVCSTDGLNTEELKLYSYIKDSPTDTDSLISALGVTTAKASQILTELLIKGLIFEEKGKYYVS